jgi:hypothetical protein
MPRLKQKTITVGDQRQRIELFKLQNQFPELFNGEYMYVVRDMDSGDRLEDPVGTRQEAERLFRRTADDIQRGMQSSASGSGGVLPAFTPKRDPFAHADQSPPIVPDHGGEAPDPFDRPLPDPGAKNSDGPFEIKSQMDPSTPWNDDSGGDDDSDGWLL